MKKRGIVETIRRKQYLIAGALIVAAAIGTTMLYSNSQEEEREQLEAELAEELDAEESGAPSLGDSTDSQIEGGESVASAGETSSAGKTASVEEASSAEDVASVEEASSVEDAEEASTVIPPKGGTSSSTGDGGAEETPTSDGAAEATGNSGTSASAGGQEDAVGEAGTDASDMSADAASGIADASDGQEAAAASAQAGTLHFSAEDGLLWPMEGEVILNYSMDSTVYFATLDQYKYNPATIISGEVNDKVYSAAKGQVSSIGNDEVTGCTVTVDLGDGYQAIYGQLKELNFDVGDYVESGHVLGYLSEPTKYFSSEGSNLYFELRKDGVPIDPAEYFE